MSCWTIRWGLRHTMCSVCLLASFPSSLLGIPTQLPHVTYRPKFFQTPISHSRQVSIAGCSICCHEDGLCQPPQPSGLVGFARDSQASSNGHNVAFYTSCPLCVCVPLPNLCLFETPLLVTSFSFQRPFFQMAFPTGFFGAPCTLS